MNRLNISKDNTKRLGEIANIRSGHHFRKSLSRVAGKGVKVIQARDITSKNNVDFSDLPSVDKSDFRKRFFIKKGDILLSSRGKFKAGVVDVDIKNTIASTSLYIISLKTKTILPTYLSVYLNSVKGQKLIRENVSGAYIKTILRKNLEDIKIVIPDVNTQKQIIQIYENVQNQERLLEQKKILTKNLSKGLINNILTKKLQ